FSATVGPKFVMEVDNATKQMTVTQDGVLVRTIPVSLGKPKTPSASGNFIIMIKNDWEWFDSTTFGVPAGSSGGYRTKVYWPQRRRRHPRPADRSLSGAARAGSRRSAGHLHALHAVEQQRDDGPVRRRFIPSDQFWRHTPA